MYHDFKVNVYTWLDEKQFCKWKQRSVTTSTKAQMSSDRV